MSERRRSARTARFYHAGSLPPGEELELDKAASHHLLTVLRASVQDRFIIFNGDGKEVHATLVDTGQRGNGKRAVLRLERCEPGIAESPLRVTLVQCVSRPERMDISLRQAVELGVAGIQPVYSRHSIKVTDDRRAAKKQQHWQSIVTSACEQCGRSTLPPVAEAMSYSDWLREPKAIDDTHFILSPSAQDSLLQQARRLAERAPPFKASLIIGPESGLDADEIEQAIHAGAVPARLGPRTLRTETAGPAAIVLLQATLGDLQP